MTHVIPYLQSQMKVILSKKSRLEGRQGNETKERIVS